MSAASTSTSPAVALGASMMPSPTVAATSVRDEGADEVEDRRHRERDPRGERRVETEVAMALAASWKPLV